MEATSELISKLVSAQHPGGGWGYGKSPRAEPTALAILALNRIGVHGSELQRSLNWLVRGQRPDGGWPPAGEVDESTWVTSLVLLAPGLPPDSHKRGLEWLLQLTSRESSRVERLRRFLLGTKLEVGEGTIGWPFFPGAAGWVTPTSAAMLALRSAAKRYPTDGRIAERLEAGRGFLLARMCPDGGWNHGSSRALGVDLTSYPETTGQALLALREQQSAAIPKALQRAEVHLARAESVEATVWLRLGLLAHGRRVDHGCRQCRGTLDLSLRLILDAAERGVDVFT